MSDFQSFDVQKMTEQLLLVADGNIPLTEPLQNKVKKTIDSYLEQSTNNTKINSTDEDRIEADELMELLIDETGFEQKKLTEQLALVVIGSANLTQELRFQALKSIEAIKQSYSDEEKTSQQQQEVANLVHGALKDLGYQVEPISHTLFVEGGNMYFRQPSWNKNYFVRLRVRPSNKQINFNVVRMANEEQKDESFYTKHNGEMQQVWCGDSNHSYQKLHKVLKDRGVGLNTVREISAEELPVQVVTADEVPVTLSNQSSKSSDQEKLTKKTLARNSNDFK